MLIIGERTRQMICMFNPFLFQCKKCDEWIDIRDFEEHLNECRGYNAG